MTDIFRYRLLSQAKNRIWAIIFWHQLFAPVGSLIYSSKQNNWLPFVAGTGLFVVGLPLAIFDLGITAFILSPLLSCLMLANKATEARRQLGIFGPEQADMLSYQPILVKE